MKKISDMNLTTREKQMLTDAIKVTIQQIDTFLPTAPKLSRYRLEETIQQYETLNRKLSTHE